MTKDYNFRFLLGGRFTSNIAGAFYELIVLWSLLALTSNPLWVSLFYASMFLPDAFSFLVGPLIDKMSKRRLLQVLEVLKGGLLFALGIVFSQQQLFTEVFLLIFFCIFIFCISFVNSQTFTVQSAYIQQSVEKKDLEDASRKLSVVYKLSNYVFGLVTGWVMLHINHTLMLFLGVLLYIVATFLMFKLKNEKKDSQLAASNSPLETETQNSEQQENPFFEGILYIWRTPALRTITGTGIIINFFFAGLPLYLSVLAHSHESPFILAATLSALGIGGFFGTAIVSKTLFKTTPTGIKHIMNYALFGLGLLLTSLLSDSLLLLLTLVASGLFWGVTHVTYSPIKQVLIPAEKMGKVSSVESTLSIGSMPLGSLFFGYFFDMISAQLFFTLFGITYLLSAVFYYRAENIRTFKLS